MKKTIFRNYDIRGIVNEELLVDEVYNLARAIATYIQEADETVKTVAVGMDGREHSPLIKDHLCKGLIDAGLDVIFLGLCTSPMVYFATHVRPVEAAIMITASHNPPEYNGFKICLGKTLLHGDQIRTIGQLYEDKRYKKSDVKGAYYDQPIHNEYITWHAEHFSHLKGMQLPVVIDCGNGAAAAIVPDFVRHMGWDNVHLLCDVIGGNTTHDADPTRAQNMEDVRSALATTEAVVGVGFDGDADRMGAMTKQGELVGGDKLLAVFAGSMIDKHPGMTVVYNVVCSAGLAEILEQWGAQTVVTPVGHSIVEENMIAHNALLGGETSCHFFFRDRHFGYDDGLYAMLRLFDILVGTGKTLSDLISVFPHKVTSLEYRIACSEEEKYAIVNEIKGHFYRQKQFQVSAIDGVRVTSDYGWGLLRASNTQPVLSIRFEADTLENLHHIKEDFIVVLCHYFDQAFIREHLEM